MTDDGNPIEFSWDWGSKGSSPTIGYSVDLIISMRALFCDQLIFSNTGNNAHLTRISYAFDLKKGNTIAKTYFFPAHRATSESRSTWDVIDSAIRTAPQCTDGNLAALYTLKEFFAAGWESLLELEMLATDLVDPVDARLKISFRSRDASTDSIGRILSVNGLGNLIFDLEGGNLWEKQHRTTGMLYYVTFKLGYTLPNIKLYILVRHYPSNDRLIFKRLESYLNKHHDQNRVVIYAQFLKQALQAHYDHQGSSTYQLSLQFVGGS
ncbi:hypothetical protein P154DRAFT_546216 [Amniculicola lignicola CBS 123094]|uniref:Aromatic prenyltransferase n=1 Tax=Amniculicola lignicola CBS 123094 TaxID=1392246 RepID=A0A6A5WCU0_9PLEO|nr:hypothetical protein P154DRAFT_546216 [Amniculicola lignicola CBS 123094]